MAFVPPKDRVMETSISNSQTVFALAGAVDTSFNRFSASMAVNDTTVGAVVEPGVAFKTGILTYSATNQVTIDSNGFESKGTFSSGGTKEVFMGMPASRAQVADLLIPSATDFNNMTVSGTYNPGFANYTNTPDNSQYWYLEVSAADPTQYVRQVATLYLGPDQKWMRTKQAGTWTAWKRISPLPLVLAKTANYTIAASDQGKFISASIAQGSTLLLGSPAAATVGNGWSFFVENTGYGAVVFDPNGSETIDGRPSINVFKGQSFEIVSDGASWKTKGRQTSFTIASAVPSGAGTVDFTLPDGLVSLELKLIGVFPGAASDALGLRTSADGVSFDAGANDYGAGIMYASSASTLAYNSGFSNSYILLSSGLLNAGGNLSLNGSVVISRPAGLFSLRSEITQYNNALGFYSLASAGGYRAAGTPKSMRLFMTPGSTISAESIILIGRDR